MHGPISEPVDDLLAGVLSRFPSRPCPGGPGVDKARQSRIVRSGPSVLIIQGVAQVVKSTLPAGRRDVHASPGCQFNAGHDDVDVLGTVILLMQNCAPYILAWLQSSKSNGFKIV
jgi:hypothetical protein